MKSYSTTIAIFGGDSRQKGRWDHLSNEVTYYTAPSLGGNGEQRRLAAAIKGGRIKAVYVLVKWIGHSASSTIKTLCHQYNVPYRIIATNHHI